MGNLNHLIIGEKGKLSASTAQRRARKLAKAMALMPADDTMEFSVFGFDDDPRELWDIPEVRDYVVTFAATLVAEGGDLDRLLLQTRQVIACCRATPTGRTVLERGARE